MDLKCDNISKKILSIKEQITVSIDIHAEDKKVFIAELDSLLKIINKRQNCKKCLIRGLTATCEFLTKSFIVFELFKEILK